MPKKAVYKFGFPARRNDKWMDKIPERVTYYASGCGILLIAGGLISLIAFLLGANLLDSNREVLHLIVFIGDRLGSIYFAAGIFIVTGLILVLVSSRADRLRNARALKKDGVTPPTRVPTTSHFVQRYLQFIEFHMQRSGFEAFEYSPEHAAYKNAGFNSEREYAFVFELPDQPLTVEKIQAASRKIFKTISRKRSWVSWIFGPRVLFCYPVILAEDAPEHIQKFMRKYKKSHFGEFEFPVLVDVKTMQLYYLKGSPVWGFALYSEIRATAESILRAPDLALDGNVVI